MSLENIKSNLYAYLLNFNKKNRDYTSSHNEELNLNKLQIVEAFEAKNLAWYQLNKCFNEKKSQKIYHGLLFSTEVARTLSHLKVYQQISQNPSLKPNDFVLIVEDGNIYSPKFLTQLDQILEKLQNNNFNYTELVLLSYFTNSQLKETYDNNLKLSIDYISYLGLYQQVSQQETIPRTYIPYCRYSVKSYNNEYKPFYLGTCPNTVKREEYLQQNLIYYQQALRLKPQAHLELKFILDFNIHLFIGVDTQLLYSLNSVDSVNFKTLEQLNESHVNEDQFGVDNNSIKIFPLNFIRPQENACSCYLIRKRTCTKVLKKYKLPFWYAIDFKQFIPTQNIALVSPFLCYQPSSIYNNPQDRFTEINKYFGRWETTYNNYCFKILKNCKWLELWQYSSNPLKQKLSNFTQKLLGLKY